MSKLLSIISENSDFSIEELASMTGMSQDEVKAEIKDLEEKGILKGYQAIINWEKVEDSGVSAFIELKVSPRKDTGFDKIAEVLCEYNEVYTAYLMAGAYDILLIVRGKTIQEISNFVATKIATIDGILSTSTHFILKEYKDNGVLLNDGFDDTDSREQVL